MWRPGQRVISQQLAKHRRLSQFAAPRTLYDKIFDEHVVSEEDGTALLYVDRHLVHELSSAQAFEGLAAADRPVRRPDNTLATVDHVVPTGPRSFTFAAIILSSLL